MIYIAICEDDVSIGNYLEELIRTQAENEKAEINIEVFLTAEECLDYIKENHSFDLLFLDIELGNMSGIELAETIRNDLGDDYMQIVYISAKESYAMKLFETQPLNFLVKPIEKEKLKKVFCKAIKILEQKEEVFCYKKGHSQKKVFIKDILYFEVQNRKIIIYSKNAKDTFYGALKNIAEELKKYHFFLCHKSFLIHYEKVRIFESSRLIMENGDEIFISQAKRQEVKEIQMEMEIRNL